MCLSHHRLLLHLLSRRLLWTRIVSKPCLLLDVVDELSGILLRYRHAFVFAAEV